MTLSDSFITFLNAQLQGDPPVKWLRATKTDASSAVLQHDACNVKVLGYYDQGPLEEGLLSVDVLGSDERQAMEWCRRIKDIMSAETTPEYDFSGPAPQHTGRNIHWDCEDLNWQLVRSANSYVHYNMTFMVRHGNPVSH
jgi:hypothetical protein